MVYNCLLDHNIINDICEDIFQLNLWQGLLCYFVFEVPRDALMY